MSILGTRVTRVEDPRLLTEGGRYVADLRDRALEGAVHATFVRSTVAHALVAGVAVEEARRLPGVVDVIAGAEVDLPPVPGVSNRDMARPLVAADRVRFVGEPVAIVLSETPEQGADAAEWVVVDYDPLPPVVDPVDGLRGETVLFPELGTNLVTALGDGGGADAPGGPAGCEVVVRQRIVNQRLAPAPLEGRSAAAAWVDGRLVLWCSTQNAHGLRHAVASTYGLDEAGVRVVAPDVGGGFGAKIGGHPEDLVLGWLARRCGRPVRWTETRTENLTAMVHGRAQVHEVTIGGRRDGTIEAYHLDIVQDAGAYPSMGAFLPRLTRAMAAGTYAVPVVTSSARVALTTTTPVASYRGAGRPEATAAIERAVDLFAAEVGLDPADVRRRNLLPAFAEAHTTPAGATYDCGDYPAALERVLAAAGYDDLRAEQARRRRAGDHRVLGIGVSCYVEVTSGLRAGSEFGRVEIRPTDDSGAGDQPAVEAVVTTGSSPHGQGLATALAMVVADETGLPVEAVRVVHGDTDAVARGTGTFGSRSLQLGGSAALESTRAVVAEARRRAAEQLEASVDDVVLDPATGRFHVVGSPAFGRSWADVVGPDGRPAARGSRRCAGARRRTGLHHDTAHLPVRRPRGGRRGRHRDGSRPARAARGLRRRGTCAQPAARRRPTARRAGAGRGAGPLRAGGVRPRRQPADNQLRRLRHPVGGRAPDVRAGGHGDADMGEPVGGQGHRRIGHDRCHPRRPERGVRRARAPRRPPRRHALHPRAGVARDPRCGARRLTKVAHARG